jgi:hypothetical protein
MDVFKPVPTVKTSRKALRGDGLALLRSLPGGCTPLVFFDPQHRGVLDKRRSAAKGALRVAGNDQRIHRPVLARVGTGACAERLSAAVDRHIPFV